MCLGACEVGCVWQNTYAWARAKLKGGLYRNILKIHFGTIVESDLQTPPPSLRICTPIFFRYKPTQNGTGLNPNRDGS